MMTEFICDLINTYFVIGFQGAIFSDEGQSGTSLETIPPSSRFQFKFQLGNESNLVFIGVELWQHCRGFPLSFHTTTHVKYLAITGCKFGCPGEDSHGFIQASGGEGLRSGPWKFWRPGRHEPWQNQRGFGRWSMCFVYECCLLIYIYIYLYLWYLRPIITNNYWIILNPFSIWIGGESRQGMVRICQDCSSPRLLDSGWDSFKAASCTEALKATD